jgi:mannose-6-phosphate isomerase
MELPARIDKPWGHELWFARTDRYAGKVLHVKQGHRLSLQYHRSKDETSYVLRGRLRLTSGTDLAEMAAADLGPGDIWRNPPGTIHTIEALEDADIVEVSTPELEDVVRLEDDYGRAGTSEP